LDGNGEHTAMRGGWCLSDNKKYNYLQKCEYNGEWFLSEKFPSKSVITLTELEKLLEDELRNKS